MHRIGPRPQAEARVDVLRACAHAEPGPRDESANKQTSKTLPTRCLTIAAPTVTRIPLCKATHTIAITHLAIKHLTNMIVVVSAIVRIHVAMLLLVHPH